MKVYHFLFILILPFSTFTNAGTVMSGETSAIKSAVMEGYQSQRNLAYGYAHGWGKDGDPDYLPQNSIKACAWRKIIILANSNKVDASDYGNESVDCKKISASNNGQVWKLVFTGLSLIDKTHPH